MAIDGRQLMSPPPEKQKKDAYDTTGLKVAASLMVVVPLAAIVAFAYWSGTWFGGTLGGVLGLVSTVATVAVIWAFRRRRH